MSQECMQTFVLVYGDETSGEDDSETAFRRGGRLVNLPTPWSLLSALEPPSRRGNELLQRTHVLHLDICTSDDTLKILSVPGADIWYVEKNWRVQMLAWLLIAPSPTNSTHARSNTLPYH